MKNRIINNRVANVQQRISRYLIALACCALLVSATSAQQTIGGTQILNQASATYSDGSGNNFTTVSNTVTVTVANVSGLQITPDGVSQQSVIPGQQGVVYTFRVTNTGNFADQVRFLANGQSIQLTGSATIVQAVIDDGDGVIDSGDVNIFTNGSDILSGALAANGGFFDVLVLVNIAPGASAGSIINVRLGDTTTNSPSYDNQPANLSSNEVRTVSTASVNGLREARGDVSSTVDSDAQLRLNLAAPTGPLALGSDINYAWELCNTGSRDAVSTTLVNGPAGSNTGVFIIAPVPVGTTLKAGQTFPAGTLYTTSPLSVDPLLAVYTTTAPANLATVTRVAFRVGATLAPDTCATPINMLVTITTTDATLNILQIGDAFANNNIGQPLTDQSGDTVSNAGDGNANFNEGNDPGNVDGNGIIQVTTLQRLGSVLIGPLGNPGASGPQSQNDDYTNRSVTTGIAGIPFGGTTTAPGTVIFTNTIQNTGNTSDTFSITAPNVPAGFTVEISTNAGLSYTTVVPGSGSVSIFLPFGGQENILVRITAPAGLAVLQDGGFSSVIRATSTASPSSFNETIDRIYTGVLRMDKTATVTNETGVGGANDPVPGAVIEYVITYRNIASTGGTGSSSITVTNLVINENGNAAPNTWGATTDHVVGSASDSLGGTILGDAVASSALSDTVPSVAPQTTGVFKFKRTIK